MSLTTQQVFALLPLPARSARERGAIVKTVTTTSMLYKLGEIYNVPVYRDPGGASST